VTAFDRDLLAAKTAPVERHLSRVAAKLPAEASDLKPLSDASDAGVSPLTEECGALLRLYHD